MPERFSYFRPSKKARKFRKRRDGPSFYERYGPHWPALRLRILTRDNWQCCHCGRVMDQKWEAQVDHKVRKAMGGDDSDENLQSLCIKCHSLKSHRERKSS